MADRVDKSWQKKGLEGFSTPAIIATLQHYGVQVDDAAFRELTKDSYPLQVANDWHGQWKGTGQFSKFPYAAATELYKRAWPERLAPADFAKALADLLRALQALLNEAPNPPVAAGFEKVASLRERVPKGDALQNFMDEVIIQLGDGGARAFDELAEQLARDGHVEQANAFAALEEQLLPDRRGIASAVVQAVVGDSAAALQSLEAIAQDEGRTDESRVVALDALIHLDAFEPATRSAEPLLQRAEKADDFHLGLALCERLAYLLEKQEKWTELQALADRAKTLADAHDRAHPHHAH